MVVRLLGALALIVGVTYGTAAAEPLSVKAVMSPKEQIRADLPTAAPHFVLFVRREGRAAGTGVLNGAALTEYGMHGLDGKPKLLDNGVWRFIGGTGALDGIKGAGTMHIKAVSPADREFQLEGEAIAARR